ncbi:hypothetical protein B0J15DRAFT_186487 [Fusarium solani]|uniref:Uncharacterized protein n=1 Tax=Fusarium solani TaxID=169388 RepID=A0A9P9L2G6_FUSSL|nr:uncharacterized protein B0J15DRAFT_186487 [Fusarium solani]KAH7272771.1 hypothetical protein B0J15DRAFT_186487 [Fusarium solani]
MGLGSHSPSHRLVSRLRQYKTTIILNGLASCWNVRLSLRHPPSKLCRPDLATQLVLFSPSRLSAALFCLCGCLLFPVRPHHHHNRTALHRTRNDLHTVTNRPPFRSCLVLTCLVSRPAAFTFWSKSPQSPRGATEGERERKQEKKQTRRNFPAIVSLSEGSIRVGQQTGRVREDSFFPLPPSEGVPSLELGQEELTGERTGLCLFCSPQP